MPYDWNRHKAPTNGDEQGRYVKFANKGDRVAGSIIDINETTFGGSRPDPVPNLVLSTPDGSVREVGCAQTNLLRQVADLSPQIGDHIEIEYLGEGTKSPGKNPPKLFKVVVTPKAMMAGASAAPAQPAGATAAEPFGTEPF